jgi:16S rRNA (guanine527-N7)-methyltransferase
MPGDDRYGPAEFAAEFNVPRETLNRLESYAALLAERQTQMNLVGPSTIPTMWQRHFRDSAQLLDLVEESARSLEWLDMGSGAGFPGIVLAALGCEHVTLVEATKKKCAFLSEVVQACGLERRVTIRNARLEERFAVRAQIIVARACASLAQLFDWGLPFAAPSTRWLLPKGKSVEDEVHLARSRFDFDFELVQSRTDPNGRIVVARGVRHRRMR